MQIKSKLKPVFGTFKLSLDEHTEFDYFITFKNDMDILIIRLVNGDIMKRNMSEGGCLYLKKKSDYF